MNTTSRATKKTPAEQLAYMRGYNAGRNRQWPEHRPPVPPDGEMRALLLAAMELRDATDNFTGGLMPDDDFCIVLDPKIDNLNAALGRFTRWLTECPTP